MSCANRTIIRTIFRIAWPAIIEQALQTVVQYADSAMVGRLGVQATASVGLTTTVTWLTNSPLWALGVGVLACIAHAIGAKDQKTTRSAALQAIWLALIAGGLMTLVTELAAPHIPSWLHADQEIRQSGYVYFAVVCAPLIFRSLSIVLASALRASGNTRTPMRINLCMNAINIALNYLLIFPPHMIQLFGLRLLLPGASLGVIGAAIATAVSIVFSGSAMLISLLNNPLLNPSSVQKRWDKPVLLRCIRVGIPVALQNIFVFSGHVVFSGMITSLGKVALATHSIAITAEQAFYIPGFGMEAAASTLCGNAAGEKDESKLDAISRSVLFISMSMMTITGALLFLFPKTLMSLFTNDPEVIRGGARILRIVACSEPLYAAMIIFEGVFHGVGQTRYPFFTSLFTMWCVRVLATFICVHYLNLGLEAVWLCMIADNITRATILGVRYFKGKWKKPLFSIG